MTHPRFCSVKLTTPPLFTKAFQTRDACKTSAAMNRFACRYSRIVARCASIEPLYCVVRLFSSGSAARFFVNRPREGEALSSEGDNRSQTCASELYPSGPLLRRGYLQFLTQHQRSIAVIGLSSTAGRPSLSSATANGRLRGYEEVYEQQRQLGTRRVRD